MVGSVVSGSPLHSGPEPPTEWVSTEKRWWLPRIVVPVTVLAVLVPVCVWYLYHQWFQVGPPLTLAQNLGLEGVFGGGVAVELAVLYLFPSVRRIGISPTGLVVDAAFRKFRYTWPELHEVTRTQVNRFRWNQVSSVTRTRISVGFGWSFNSFALSPNQGDRLAHFLNLR